MEYISSKKVKRMYKSKAKPELNDEEKRLLKQRNNMNKKRIKFKRQEWYRYKRLGQNWNRPKGKHSKIREHKGYKIPVVDSGFRGPKLVRGLHPSGFKDVLVHNTKDISILDPKKESARIGRTVGVRKRIEIEEKAKKQGIRILNPLHQKEESK